MIPLIQLKKEVHFNTELTHIIDALKGIAAARFHILERQMKLFELYFKAAERFIGAMDLNQIRHPFVTPSSGGTHAVLVTSDAGFLGGLNMRVVSAGTAHVKAGGEVSVIGEKGVGPVQEMGLPFTAFPGIEDASRSQLASAVQDHVIGQILQGRCGRLIVAYPKPVSFSIQQVMVEELLPCSSWAKELQKGLAPQELLFESKPADILEYVVTQWVGHRLSEIFALSRLAELAARVVHLEGSYQELLTRGKKLKLQYFRARHEVIDRSMREIYSAQLLYGKNNSE